MWFLPRATNEVDQLLEGVHELIPDDELRRFQSFKSAPAARRFLLGRILLRRIFSHYLDVPPDRLKFSVSANGKPELVGPQLPDINFNLSHDGTEAALGVTRGGVLGIDLVGLDRAAATLRVSQQFYTAEEVAELESLSEGHAIHSLKLWALKESIAKADENSIWQGLSDTSISIAGSKIKWASPPHKGNETDWNLTLGYHRDQYLLAIAQRFQRTSGTHSGGPPKISSHILRKNGIEEQSFHPLLIS